MTHWLAVTTPENWERCKATKTWGVKKGQEATLSRAAEGDDLVIYVVGLNLAGLFKITEGLFTSQERIWEDDVYPYRVRFEDHVVPPEPVSIRQFFYSFFPNVSPAGYFRTAFRELPDDEFELFREFLERGSVPTLEPLVTIEPHEEGAFALSIERDLEDYLEAHLDVLEPGLRLYQEEGVKGRQYGTDASRLDLLATDTGGNFVVIELKAGEADRSIFGQILPYMGWVREHLANGKAVRGIVVAADFTSDVMMAIREVSNLELFRYAVQFSFNRVAPVAPMSR
jgi:hypothetical protein